MPSGSKLSNSPCIGCAGTAAFQIPPVWIVSANEICGEVIAAKIIASNQRHGLPALAIALPAYRNDFFVCLFSTIFFAAQVTCRAPTPSNPAYLSNESQQDHDHWRGSGRRIARHPACATRILHRSVRAPARSAQGRFLGRTFDQSGAGRARLARATTGGIGRHPDAAGGDDARTHGALSGCPHRVAALRA